MFLTSCLENYNVLDGRGFVYLNTCFRYRRSMCSPRRPPFSLFLAMNAKGMTFMSTAKIAPTTRRRTAVSMPVMYSTCLMDVLTISYASTASCR